MGSAGAAPRVARHEPLEFITLRHGADAPVVEADVEFVAAKADRAREIAFMDLRTAMRRNGVNPPDRAKRSLRRLRKAIEVLDEFPVPGNRSPPC